MQAETQGKGEVSKNSSSAGEGQVVELLGRDKGQPLHSAQCNQSSSGCWHGAVQGLRDRLKGGQALGRFWQRKLW